jgi:hypothetical protein
MSSQFFQHHHIVPIPEPEAEAVLQTFQLTYEFYDEVRYRDAFEQYCDWYAQLAAEHQQDLEQMRQEVNLFNWLSLRRNQT